MPQTNNIASPIKGMVHDLHILNIGEDSYTFALNAMSEDFSSGNGYFLQNEPSNHCSVKFPPEYEVVGFREIPEQNRTIYLLTNPRTGNSQFGEVRNCVYEDSTDKIKNTSCKDCSSYVGEEQIPLEKKIKTCYCSYSLIVECPCLGLNVNYPVDIEYKITNCGINIYFTDDINERRFVYFDYLNNDPSNELVLQDRFKVQLSVEEPCDTPVYDTILDCEKIKFHPTYNRPCIDFIDFVNGGNLKEGTYQVLIAYADAYGNPISQYFPSTQTIPLFKDQIKFETNNETAKAIKFQIQNLKTNSVFKYYNIVIAQTIEQFTEFIFVGTFNTTQTSYVYTGFEKAIKRLNSMDVFFKRPYYKTARGITKANNYLFFTGVKEYPLLNLQPVANKIKLQWETIAIKESDYFNPKNTFKHRTFLRDEVYALGIVFEFDNGRETCAFHIPGRKSTEEDLEALSFPNEDILTGLTCDDVLDCLDGLTITAMYREDKNTVVNGYTHPCNLQGTHNCNRATFNVFANNENIGIVNLNNGGVSLGCGYPDLFPDDYGGDRTSTLTLTQEQIQTIAYTSVNGGITIKLTCANITPCSCHEDTQWVQITNSSGTVLYNGCMVAGTEYTFYPCSKEVKKWEIYNTATVLGGEYDYSEICDDNKCWEYGDFAYWESTEMYPKVPEIWGDLCGQPIRHHKFPDCSISHIHDRQDIDNITNKYASNNYIFPIGIKVDHDSVRNAIMDAVDEGILSMSDALSIVSYRIVRGNRVGNKSIDAKGLIFNMFEYEKFGETYYFPNYAYNDLSSDDFLDNVELSTLDRFTFHSPDTHFVNASLGNILKVETEEYGKSEGYFTHSECQPKFRFINRFGHTLAFGLGLAAAISATGEKQCRVITYKSDYNTDVNNFPTPDISGGSYANVLASGSGTIDTHISTSVTRSDYSETETHNNQDGTNKGNNPITGQPINIADYETEQITYCKGQSFQIFGNPVDNIQDPVLKAAMVGLTMGISNIVQRTFLGLMEMDKILTTIRMLIPKKNYSAQYNSVGKYNAYKTHVENNINRRIDKSSYLAPTIQTIDEPSLSPDTIFDTIKVNNWNRESSVYLKLARPLSNPTINDNSKVSMRNAGISVDDLGELFYRDISSYYVSIKRNVLNQYGQLCNIEYLETNGCSFYLNQEYDACQLKVFGGDTFINRFGLKRKMPFFLQNYCKLPDEITDIQYSTLANAGSPKYYFNTPTGVLESFTNIFDLANPINIVDFIINDNDRVYDVFKNHLFHQDGLVTLFNYGIPYFLVESDINLSYRHGQNNEDKDFYPHNRDLKAWLEEETVPISIDNYYFYNRTYSKQNKESAICTSCIIDPKDLICQTTNYNRLIYSEPSTSENNDDNWLIFKANNYYDFPLTLGKLITADGIENDKVLVRLEKGTQIFSAYNTIQATGENIQVGTGGMFKTRPQDIALTDLGYAGTQHKDILHTEYGHVWADAERGQVFNLQTGGQGGMDEISKTGMKSWFKENLPFNIKKDFPLYNIDNNLNGVGLHYCFDKRFNRLLITKLDYKCLDNRIAYDGDEHEFYYIDGESRIVVNLWNPKYFCNKSWTISYNFYQKSWTSYHSYHPLYYVEHIAGFDSATTKLSIENERLVKTTSQYTHNISNKSYQVFYDKLEPFIIEFQSKPSMANSVLNSVEYYLDVIRYHNEFDAFYNRTKTFNKAIIYNERQTSGLLRLKVHNPENLYESISYPKRVDDGYEVLVTNSENMWRFNDFWDVSQSQLNNVPLFTYDCNNVIKSLNKKALHYDKADIYKSPLRQRMCRIRLINDDSSNYHFIFSFGQINQKQSFR